MYPPGTEAVAPAGWARPRGLVLLRPATKRVRSEGVRRTLNVVVAALALVVALPLMMVIAVAIRLTSAGPVLYRQTRVGIDRRTSKGGNWRRTVDYGGKLFTIYKFRTMYDAADRQAQEVWATPDDPRVTPLGRVLRKYRLDELPQLLNVLRGEMNVVGPRPEQPKIFMTLREQVDRYAIRQRVLPGITGWAQINQDYDRCLDDVRRKVHLDMEYLQRVSVLEDLRILARTLPVVLSKKGAW
jgi:lipopolysaccharide/colanic/teichoic acid biosynthesis glycosyltransferase